MKFFLIIWQNIESSVSSTFMRYLRLPKALQGTLFWKNMIFHELFQVGACPNLKDSLLFDRISILMYKARIIRYLQQLSSICDSFMPCTVHFFVKKMIFMKYFKLVHAPTWKIPHYMKGILFICTRQEEICIYNNFPLSASLLFLVRYIFLEKDGFSWNISCWCMPQLERFLLIWQVFYQYVQGKKHSVSSTIFLYLRLSYALYGTFFSEKDDFSWNISSWCMSQLERFLITSRFSIHMYKARSISVSYTIFLYLRLSYALYGPFFSKKDDFFMKYFKLVHAPTWKIPYNMTGFLSICTRHEAFGISNIFPLSATPSCPVRFFLFLEKDEFLINYFKLVHAPTWKIH